MLCARCYKKIPEGEEVTKTSGYWRVNGWGRYGNEIYCKKCALWQDKKDRTFFVFFFMFPFVMMGIVLIYLVLMGLMPLRILFYSIPGWLVIVGIIWSEFFSTKNQKKK